MKKTITFALLCLTSLLCGSFLTLEWTQLTKEDITHASNIVGMSFSGSEKDSMLPILEDQRRYAEDIRKLNMKNDIMPAFTFNPVPPGMMFDMTPKPFKTIDYKGTHLPAALEGLEYYSVGQLAELIRSKQITSEKLTAFFLTRLKRYDKKLLCVIQFTEEQAMREARQADAEIKAGKYKGLLHGIPFGIKDMYATHAYPTTYGTTPYREQMLKDDATVVRKLREAGAVMIAKLSLGELAMDDVWFGGKTRCPWDTTRGSSGSSAGPAAAVSAGLVPFAIGSETWGSIVSPSTVCGVTGLRPTFGRVSRKGAMALSWTMDKVGPLCRNAEDCAIVLNAIYGQDGQDLSVSAVPFNYSPAIQMKGLRVGYLEDEFKFDTLNGAFNQPAMDKLKKMGAELIPLKLPDFPVNDLQLILFAECGAAFDELTQSKRDGLMAQQGKYNWPNLFRASHFISAVDYIQAMRARSILISRMAELMSKVDVMLAPALWGNNLLTTNLTGHPCIVFPNGFTNEKTPVSLVMIGQLYQEGRLIAAAKAYQDATDFHLKHPPLN
jgi:Asp-tRNA(Asn)/Glu-tRNA(Gln) amidotransferase A subunit family amidase